MIKYKYRFKTEKEFIDEYGINWRRGSGRIYWTSSNSMDYLFNTEIDPIYYKEFLDKNGRLYMTVHDKFDLNRWTINIKMIKEIKVGINYNEPKKLVYD